MRSELQNIVDGLASVLGVPTSLTDSQFNSIVFGPHEDADIDQLRRQALLNRQTSPQVREWFESFGTANATGPLRIPADTDMSAKSRVVIPARWGTVTYGFLCLLDDQYQLTEDALATATEAMPEIARLLLRQHRDRQRGADTLYHLLSSAMDERERAASDLRMARGSLTSRAAVIHFASAIDELTLERSIDDVLRRVATRTLPVLRLVESGRAIFLLLTTSAALSHSLMSQVAEQCFTLSPQTDVVLGGIGDEVTSYTDVAVSLEQAELAARAAAGLCQRGSHVAKWSELGATRILVSLPQQRIADALDPRFEALLGAKDASLIPTLEAYLDNATHVQKTADALGIHRGTLYYRLRRAQQESGFDLSDGLDVLSLHLAIKSLPFLPGAFRAGQDPLSKPLR